MKETFADFSIPIVEKKFEKFNVEYFGGKLTKPRFTLNVSKNTLGRCSIKGTPTITLSIYYNVKEEDMENTLIHEMVHLYQHQVIKEAMNHTASFKRLSAEIDKKSNGKYIITRTSSRKGYSLSTDGLEKQRRRNISQKNPTIILFKETNAYGEEYAWLMRVSDKLANNVKMGAYYLSNSFQVIGFIYDKPQDWMYETRVCRSRLTGGRKLRWTEFVKKHSKDIIPFVVK